MSIILFLRVLWKRLAMSLSPSSIQIAGLWDSGRLRAEATEDLRAWKNVLLLHPRRETVNNGVVVTRVEHLKDDSTTSGEHEFLRIHVLHEKSKEKAVFIVDRDFWPKDLHGPPERNGNVDSLELETEKAKKQSSPTNNGNAKEPEHAGQAQNHSDLVCHRESSTVLYSDSNIVLPAQKGRPGRKRLKLGRHPPFWCRTLL
jgi:hypothetical protein